MSKNGARDDNDALPAHVLERLKQLIHELGGDEAAARVAGVSKTQVGRWRRGVSTPPLHGAAKLCIAANKPLDWLWGHHDGRDLVRVPVLNVRASAGHGAWNEQDEVRELVPMTAQLLRSLGVQPEAVRIIEAHGDSMSPTVQHGDLLVVDTAQRDPRLGGIYVFRAGDHLQVKRVKVSPQDGSIMFGSDNPDYGPFQPEDLERLDILGRVVWVWRRAR